MRNLLHAIDNNMYETLVLCLVKRSGTMTVQEFLNTPVPDLYRLARIVSEDMSREAEAVQNAQNLKGKK